MLVDKLANIGKRQFQAQYEIVFPNGIPFGTNTTGEEVKIMQRREVQIPEREVDTVDWFYRGIKITDIVPVDASSKEIELEFHIDQGWRIYKDMMLWRSAIYNERTGIAGDRTQTGTTLILNAYDEAAIAATWKFRGLRPKNVGTDAFSHEGNDYMAMRIMCIFDFIEYPE